MIHQPWTVVYGKPGRVKPEVVPVDNPVNEAEVLEKEADAMGCKALGKTPTP